MQKSFWLVLLGVLAAMIGLFFLVGGSEQTTDSGQYAYEDAKVVQEQDHSVGSGPVVIIEYGDFQCPGCASLHPLLKQLKQDRAKDIIFVFRHYPLTSLHANAMAAHRAAEAAAKQNKFWEMHDTLYEQQDVWKNSPNPAPLFESYAEQLELNVEQFKTDSASEDVFQRISADMNSGQSLSLTGTPSIMLDGTMLEDVPQSLAEFNALIDAALKN